jgi:hypothetical protein
MRTDIRLTREIESLILGMGADLVGVAPVERFEGNTPPGWGPTDYMKEATCVISMAMHQADGVCDAWGEYTSPGKSISPYLFYGYGLINLEMSRIANTVAKRLEYKGFKSLMFPPTWTVSFYRWYGLREGALRADFSHRHAAVAAGLGEFGWNGLTLTPGFGSRARFNSIITNAPLVPSPMYEGPPICQPERCRKLCTRVCPTQAFTDDILEVTVGERRFEYPKVDVIRCQYGTAGLVKGSGSIMGVEIPPGPGNSRHLVECLAKQHGPDKVMADTCFGIICGAFCGQCLHQCPAHIYWRTGVAARGAKKVS